MMKNQSLEMGISLFLEVGNSAPIDTNNYLKNIIEPNHNLTQVTGNITGADESVDNSGWDEDVIREDIAQIKENIYYDEMSARYRAEYNSRFDELFEVMVDLVAGKRKRVAEYRRNRVSPMACS